MLFDSAPHRPRSAPALARDLLRMLQSVLENLACASGHFGILKTNHQFVIDVQAALIEVRRTDIDDIIDDDQFRMKNLRLVFINLNTGFQKATIQAPASQFLPQTQEGPRCAFPAAKNACTTH